MRRKLGIPMKGSPLWSALPVALSLLVSALIAHAGATTVKAILENPSRYDGQDVTVTGETSEVKSTVSRRGNPYTTFRLSDASGAAITIYTRGNPDVKSGEAVRVTGTFRQVKRVGRYTFNNQIDADRVSLMKQ